MMNKLGGWCWGWIERGLDRLAFALPGVWWLNFLQPQKLHPIFNNRWCIAAPARAGRSRYIDFFQVRQSSVSALAMLTAAEESQFAFRRLRY
jgi:hypothetical protein